MTRVFVYGTLRTGGAHWRGHLSPACGTRGVTEAAYTMRSLGRLPIVEVNGSTAITGEVFEVDTDTLASLDRLEGHPDWYERVEIDVRCDDGLRRAWIYLMPTGRYDDRPVIEGGDWLARPGVGEERLK